MDWKAEAEYLLFDLKMTWPEIDDAMMKYFPKLDKKQVHEKVRTYLRRRPRYKERQKQLEEEKQYKGSIEFKNGRVTSDKIIEICEGEEITPEVIMKAHNIYPGAWEVISYKNNYWHSQIKGGKRLVMYQSKLTVKPRKEGITLEAIDKHFKNLDRIYKPAIILPTKQNGNMMAEVNIADLHLGKLCWRGDTLENFDYKIARSIYYNIISEIVQELKNKNIEYITFVWANDFFNSDNIEQTTTGGTRQDTDVRWQKLFNVGVEMLVSGIEMLKEAAPVKTFWTPSNHDEVTGYHALKYLEAWFRGDHVEIDSSAAQRKYRLYGNTLIGYAHGCKIQSTATKEKASRLASLMPIEARELWSKALYHEMHVGHLHSEQMTQEINGVIVRRISSPTADDAWHTESGYIGAIRKAQTFIYDKETGLRQIINTPVQERYFTR